MPYLTQSETIYVIPKGAEFNVLIDGKTQNMIAEQDRLAVAKGTYMELVKEADQCSK